MARKEAAAVDVPAPAPAEIRRWIRATYQATALFSLRTSFATSAGGKALLVPSPYAIKLGLVDSLIRATQVVARGEALFNSLKTAATAITPAERVAVTSTFVRVLKAKRGDAAEDGEANGNEAVAEDAEEDTTENVTEDEPGPYQRTIAYREMCHLGGPLVLGIGLRDESAAGDVGLALAHLNYLGKRGGFIQLERLDGEAASPSRDAVIFDPLGELTQPGVGTVACWLDDVGVGASFSAVNSFSTAKSKWDRERRARLCPSSSRAPEFVGIARALCARAGGRLVTGANSWKSLPRTSRLPPQPASFRPKTADGGDLSARWRGQAVMRKAFIFTGGTGIRPDVDSALPLTKAVKRSGASLVAFVASETSKPTAERMARDTGLADQEHDHPLQGSRRSRLHEPDGARDRPSRGRRAAEGDRRMRTAAELQRHGWQALVKELGLADALRYRILFQPGHGDYVEERRGLFAGTTLEGWLRDLQAWEVAHRATPGSSAV